MKSTKLFKFASLAAMVAATVFANSCKKQENTIDTPKGEVAGLVTDELGTPIIDVEVTIKGTKLKAITAVDGSYSIKEVPMTKQTVEFKKDGYATSSATITAASFKEDKATVNVKMLISGCKITGKCLDAKNGNVGMKGVNVSLNAGAKTTTTDDEGVYVFEDLTIDDYTLLFTMAGCVDVEKKVSKEQFTGDFVVTVEDVRMGAKEILPGATAEDLKLVDTWHYNEYRGGKNGDDYPHFDWSTDFMGTFTSWYGWWEEQNEGTTLQIRNSEADGHWKNPADHEHFDSYLAGRKTITEDNCIMSIKMRTHACSEDAPAHWGVMVIDLSAAEPEAELIGNIIESYNESYSNPDHKFDLSKYIGKEVVIAIGIYRWETGDYWKQLVLRRIAFRCATSVCLDDESFACEWLVVFVNRHTRPPSGEMSCLSPVLICVAVHLRTILVDSWVRRDAYEFGNFRYRHRGANHLHGHLVIAVKSRNGFARKVAPFARKLFRECLLLCEVRHRSRS